MFNLILFGPPGSGKGTQSEKLMARFGLKHLSTGDLLRSEIKASTALGQEAKKLMDLGQLVPDEVVIGMISSALATNPDGEGFLFDGFPRTKAQSEALDALLATYNACINVLIALKVSEDELVRRLLNRGLTSGRSDDTKEDVIRARLAEYNSKTAVVEEYYSHSGKVIAIQGEGTEQEVFTLLSNAILANK